MTSSRISSGGPRRKSVKLAMKALSEGIIEQKASSVNGNEQNTDQVGRYMTPDMEVVMVNTRRNIATFLLGQERGEAVLDFLIYKGLRAKVLSVLLMVMWMTGQILGVLSLHDVVSPAYGRLGGLLTLPCLLICGYSVLIIDVLKKLLRRFDTYYLIFNIVGSVVSLSLLLKDDRVVYICTGFLISGIWSTLADAMPTNSRRNGTIFGLGLGLVLLGSTLWGLYRKSVKITEARYLEHDTYISTCIMI